jgi:hypothetical protein
MIRTMPDGTDIQPCPRPRREYAAGPRLRADGRAAAVPDAILLPIAYGARTHFARAPVTAVCVTRRTRRTDAPRPPRAAWRAFRRGSVIELNRYG